jgi:hypothetical protein
MDVLIEPSSLALAQYAWVPKVNKMPAEILLFRGKNASVPATVSVHGTHAMRSPLSLLHADEVWKTLEGGRPSMA